MAIIMAINSKLLLKKSLANKTMFESSNRFISLTFIPRCRKRPSYQCNHFSIVSSNSVFLGIVSPYVVGLITSGPSGQTVSKWREVFYIAAGVYAVTALFYLIFASGEPERWEKKEKMDKENASRDSDSITSAQIPG